MNNRIVVSNGSSIYEKAKNLTKTIQSEMQKGNEVSLLVVGGKELEIVNGGNVSKATPIRFYYVDNPNARYNSYPNQYTIFWDPYGGHHVKINGLTREGIIVPSWGHRTFIPFADILANDAYGLLVNKFYE